MQCGGAGLRLGMVLGFESVTLSLGPWNKDEESAKPPGPLLKSRAPESGAHEADASTAISGEQSGGAARR